MKVVKLDDFRQNRISNREYEEHLHEVGNIMFAMTYEVDQGELREYIAQIAMLFTRVADGKYTDMRDLEKDYGMLFSRTFVTKTGAFDGNIDLASISYL
jgi:hypothetical protein